MKLDTLGLEAFVAIAEHGRFHKAADALHITQTALTRRLQNFEDLLGVKLIGKTDADQLQVAGDHSQRLAKVV